MFRRTAPAKGVTRQGGCILNLGLIEEPLHLTPRILVKNRLFQKQTQKVLNLLGVFGPGAGRAKLSTTTAREQNRALDPQVYGRCPNPGKDRNLVTHAIAITNR